MMRSHEQTSRRVADGGRQRAGSRGVTQYYAGNEIPLPSGSIRSPVPALKSLNLAQAVLDCLLVVLGLFAFAALFAGLPLAIVLMVLGVF